MGNGVMGGLAQTAYSLYLTSIIELARKLDDDKEGTPLQHPHLPTSLAHSPAVHMHVCVCVRAGQSLGAGR
jgi:hypothetical protein